MLYKTLVRKFPIFQTHVYDRSQLLKYVAVGNINTLLQWLSSDKGKKYLPYESNHRLPEAIFRRFREAYKDKLPENWICGDSDLIHSTSDCHLFFFSMSPEGIPGIIYTQTGFQSSLVRMDKSAGMLKYHNNYKPKLETVEVCKGLEYFSIKKEDIEELRLIYKHDRDDYNKSFGKMFIDNQKRIKAGEQ
jgi:hypothetical protein